MIEKGRITWQGRPRGTNRIALGAPAGPRPWPGLLYAALLLAGLADCGPETQLLDRDTHLTYSDLVRGRVGPLAAVTSEGDEGMREPLLNYLDRALRERRDLRIVRADQLRRALGPEVHGAVMARCERDGWLTRPELALLDSLVGSKVRYVVVARVEDETVEEDEVFHTVVSAKVTATLQIRVAFSVYDLQSLERVRTETITASAAKSWIDREAGVGEGGHTLQMPDEERAMEEVFERFAMGLPAR